jgi:hypothetical protein
VGALAIDGPCNPVPLTVDAGAVHVHLIESPTCQPGFWLSMYLAGPEQYRSSPPSPGMCSFRARAGWGPLLKLDLR